MNRTLYGSTRDGHPVHAYRLAHGTHSATVLDMGGTVTTLEVGGRNVVLGLENLAAYEASGWWNCLIGRYANRIAGGFTLAGRHYPLNQDAKGVTLHGGRGESWGKRVWQVMGADQRRLALRLVSPGGDQGFPGTVTVDVVYVMESHGLDLHYSAVSDAPTPINLTNHLYFNLAGHGTVANQRLELHAKAITPTDERQIPSGELMEVKGTPFDFRHGAFIGDRVDADHPQMRLAGGLDHNFVLAKSQPGALEWAARLTDEDSGLVLEVLTTEPGIQVYSTNNVKGDLRNAAGQAIQRRDAVALETQHFPDSPNKPHFPGTILLPGETFLSTTMFRFP